MFLSCGSCSTNLLFSLLHSSLSLSLARTRLSCRHACCSSPCFSLFLSNAHTCRHTSHRIWQKMRFLWADWYDSLFCLHLSISWRSYSQFMTGKSDLECILLCIRTYGSVLFIGAFFSSSFNRPLSASSLKHRRDTGRLKCSSALGKMLPVWVQQFIFQSMLS